MSSTDPTKVDSLILSETMRRTLLRPSHFRQLLNTKSSSLMRQITQPTTYNSSLRAFIEDLLATADSSSPATTKTKSLNLSTPDVPSLSLESKEKKKPSWQDPSSSVYKTSWMRKVYRYDPKVLAELINKHFPDWRRVLNECQRYSVSGEIDSGILASFSDVAVNDLINSSQR
jgi:hypothetical protein